MAKASKARRIKKETERLRKLYETSPSNIREIVEPLIQNAAFMLITLEDLQVSILAAGCTDEYQNGANQAGTKQSAELQAYNGLIKNYNSVSERLRRLLPTETVKSKLDAFNDDE